MRYLLGQVLEEQLTLSLYIYKMQTYQNVVSRHDIPNQYVVLIYYKLIVRNSNLESWFNIAIVCGTILAWHGKTENGKGMVY